jgi:hypothetical protein
MTGKPLWYENPDIGARLGGVLIGLLMKEHPHAARRLEPTAVQKIGTGYLFTYRVIDAFPKQKMPHEPRAAFMHEDGIIWDRSCRWMQADG